MTQTKTQTMTKTMTQTKTMTVPPTWATRGDKKEEKEKSATHPSSKVFVHAFPKTLTPKIMHNWPLLKLLPGSGGKISRKSELKDQPCHKISKIFQSYFLCPTPHFPYESPAIWRPSMKVWANGPHQDSCHLPPRFLPLDNIVKQKPRFLPLATKNLATWQYCQTKTNILADWQYCQTKNKILHDSCYFEP